MILFTLAVMNFTHIVDSMLIMPLGDLFIEQFDITAAQFGFLVSAYAFAATISSLVAFLYLDRIGRKTGLLIAYVGFTVGTLACAWAPDYYSLLIIRFVTGFFGGVIGALVLSIVSDLFLFKERGKAMGVLMAAFSVASALGIPTALFLSADGDWHLPFLIIGSMGAVISIFVAFAFPSMKDHLKSKAMSPLENINYLLKNNNQMMALLAGFVVVLSHFMIIPFISPFLIKNVGLTQQEIAYQFLLGGVATVISSPIVGYFTDKYGVNKVFIIMMLICFIPTVMITQLGVVPLYVALCYTTMFFIFASGRMIPANAIITATAGIENRGSFMSMKSALQQFAIGLSALISGSIVVINPETDLYEHYPITAYISIVVGVMAIFILRKLRVVKGN